MKRKRRLDYGKAVRILRAHQGIDRKELAEKAGISYSFLADIEKGKKIPSAETLEKLARAFGFTPSRFMLFTESLEEPERVVLYSRHEGWPERALPAEETGITEKDRLIDRIVELLPYLSRAELAALLTLVRRLAGNRR